MTRDYNLTNLIVCGIMLAIIVGLATFGMAFLVQSAVDFIPKHLQVRIVAQ